MDTRDFFPKSTPSHWYCLPLLSSIPEESRASFLAGFANMLNGLFLDTFVRRNTHQNRTPIKMEPSYYQNGILIKMEYSYYQNGTLIKMEYSYYQNGTLILSKWNTHQKWNPHIIKMEYSSKWNTHIIKMEHSYYQNGTLLLSKWNTHIIKMEHSSKRNTHQNWNTHQNGILIKNGTLTSKMQHSYYQKEYWRKSGINESDVIVLLMEWEHSYQKDCWQPETIKEPSICGCCLIACRLGRASHPPIRCTRLSIFGFVPYGLVFWSNG